MPKKSDTGDRRDILFAGAFGVHHRLHAELKAFFIEECDHSSFSFYEYFFERPRIRGETLRGRPRKSVVHGPFLERIIYESGFLPALTEDKLQVWRGQKKAQSWASNSVESVPATRENIEKYWRTSGAAHGLELEVEADDLMFALLRTWAGADTTSAHIPGYLHKGSMFNVCTDGDLVSVASPLDVQFLQRGYGKSLGAGKVPAALSRLWEYELVLRPWMRSSSSKVGLISCSVSSKNIFWGECIVLCPAGADVSNWAAKPWVVKLTKLLEDRVRETYVPMLTLLENYLLERDFGEYLTNATAVPCEDLEIFGFPGSWKSRIGDLEAIGKGTAWEKHTTRLPIPNRQSNCFTTLLAQATRNTEVRRGLSKLERALVELWADRFAWLLSAGIDPGSPPDDGAQAARIAQVRGSLVFAKYLVSSPAMVRSALKAVGLRHTKGGPGKGKVKSALVVGGPGSGKDSMAELIRLFSPGYRFGPGETLNMAMFRPKEAAVPLLLGIEAAISGGGHTPQPYTFVGVLKRILERGSEAGRGVTLILDELNSLDIDTQGALLRFLENSRIQALGGLESSNEPVDALVVAIMNENPHMIMKRRTLDRVLQQQELFGGLLSETLYETFRSQRRLRDDLYYRLIRGGEIHLPELRERREDIPVLTYFLVKKDYSDLIPAMRWDIELPAYETLMDPSLEWSGNLRELQTVVRLMVQRAADWFERDRRDPREDVLLITARHASNALRTYSGLNSASADSL